MSLLTNVLKLWRTGQYLLPADSGFMVKHLFANGEPGFAKLDFSGFAGMYQDRARTIPYTAVEQPLGSFTGLNGVTATAPADVNRGVVSARVNLLTKTEQFDDAAWSKSTSGVSSAPVVTPNAASAPDGTMTADLVVFTLNGGTSSGDFSQLSQAPGFASGPYRWSFWARTSDGSTKIFTTTDPVGNTILISVVGEYQQFIVTGVGSAFPRIRLRGGEGTASSASIHLWGASLTLEIDAHLPYQRVNTPTDYATAGFPHYLKFDGTNTAYATPSIDFTGTDKMTVWAGITKLSDTPSQIIAELSSVAESEPGSWFLASQYVSYNYFANSLGVPGNGRAIAGSTAPGVSKDRISLQLDLSAPSPAGRLNMRRNVLAVSTNVANTGYGGNYGNYPLYIGARAVTSLFFNGRLYSLIVRGAQSSLSQIEAVENLIRKTMRLP